MKILIILQQFTIHSFKYYVNSYSFYTVAENIQYILNIFTECYWKNNNFTSLELAYLQNWSKGRMSFNFIVLFSSVSRIEQVLFSWLLHFLFDTVRKELTTVISLLCNTQSGARVQSCNENILMYFETWTWCTEALLPFVSYACSLKEILLLEDFCNVVPFAFQEIFSFFGTDQMLQDLTASAVQILHHLFIDCDKKCRCNYVL